MALATPQFRFFLSGLGFDNSARDSSHRRLIEQVLQRCDLEQTRALLPAAEFDGADESFCNNPIKPSFGDSKTF